MTQDARDIITFAKQFMTHYYGPRSIDDEEASDRWHERLGLVYAALLDWERSKQTS